MIQKITLTAVICLFGILTNAQTFEIQYTQTMDIDALNDSIDSNERMKSFISEDMREQMLSRLAKPQNYTLTYSEGKSLYKIAEEKEVKDDDNLKVGKGNGFRMRFNRKRITPVLFKNHETTLFTKEQAILDKKFIIKDTLKTLEWEITDTTKSFGDYTCTVATTTNARGDLVKACYTEDIPLNEGPDNYYGLPGLVVEVIIGPRIIAMSELKMTEKSSEIIEPSEGKTITQEKFDKMMKQRMESQQNGRGGGKGVGIFHL